MLDKGDWINPVVHRALRKDVLVNAMTSFSKYQFKAHNTHILATRKWFFYGGSQSPALIIFKGEWLSGFSQHMDILLVKLIKKNRMWV